MAVTLPNVKLINGTHYFVVKVKGRQNYTPLPAPADPQFALEYAKARERRIATLEPSIGPERGTFDALIDEYRDSADYDAQKPVSRANTELYLKMFSERFGKRKVAKLTAPQVDVLRHEMKDTPGKANAYISKLRTLLNFGIRRGYLTSNPAAGVKRLKLGEHEPWPADLVERALKAADPMDRLIIITGMATGQRVADVVKIKHTDFEGDILPLDQQKTGKDVYIPIHPMWRKAMNDVPRRGEYVIYDRSGTGYSTDGIQLRMRKLMRKVGGEGFTFHGLRKYATNFLALQGFSPSQISAITGMSLEMVMHYTRAIENRRVAESIADRFMKGDLLAGVKRPAKRG